MFLIFLLFLVILLYPYKESFVKKESIDELKKQIEEDICEKGLSAIDDPEGYNNLFIHLIDNK